MLVMIMVMITACDNGEVSNDSKTENGANNETTLSKTAKRKKKLEKEDEEDDIETDKKNAEEIASQIQTCISDYESEDGGANGIVGEGTIIWDEYGADVSRFKDCWDRDMFERILNEEIDEATRSKETGEYAIADIEYKNTDVPSEEGYTITVILGNAEAKNNY